MASPPAGDGWSYQLSCLAASIASRRVRSAEFAARGADVAAGREIAPEDLLVCFLAASNGERSVSICCG
jgi:hypothetical protein